MTADLKVLFVKSGGICAFPNCKRELIVKETSDLVAHVAHIVARSDSGPRADPDVLRGERDAYTNLILLCPTHHAQIDSPSGAERWDREALMGMKETHERWVAERLAVSTPIECDLSLLGYVNLQRLAALAFLSGQPARLGDFDGPKLLLDRGIFTDQLMNSFESILRRIGVRGTPLNGLDLMDEENIGLTVTFEGRFYTRNVPIPNDVRTGKFQLTGRLDKDPHIYHKVGDARLVLPIDPKWILSMTGWGDFGAGKVRFAGACTIRRIEVERRTIVATALFIGTPRSNKDRMYW
jgi:hypothetical protein